MKNLVITHLFLNLYLLALVGPVLPVLDYMINYDYIARELCVNRDKPVLACNGKCYLEKKMVENNELLSHHSDKPTPPKLEQIAFPVFIVSESIKFAALSFESMTKSDFYYRLSYITSYIFSLLRPPQI